ncbi:MAG: hypoxanthine phosphoribosyltransferase [Bacteroidales bacterium]|nr:hypoxanthine phosphoribosyltransferase [Bacteroidales bacterium]
MERIKILDKEFKRSIPYTHIQESVQKMAEAIFDDHKDGAPLFLCVLNGCFMLAGDLFKVYKGMCEISFIKLSSYSGTTTTGEVKSVIGLHEDISGRDVIILEDIIDSGITVSHLVKDLKRYNPKRIQVATLLLKPAALRMDVFPDYVGMEIPNDFIVGYGLDYNGFGRNYKDIYKIVE